MAEKTEILRRIASLMQRGPEGLGGNMIDGSTLEGLIEEYLRVELHFERARAAARAVVEHLRERNFILCFVGADRYGFVHRTFLEYFCAADIVHQFNIAKSLSQRELIALFERHCRDDDWREVLLLVCGQIDEQFVGLIVDRLENLTDLTEWQGETPLPRLLLAVRCLAEVRNTTRLEETGARLMKQTITMVTKAGLNGDVISFLKTDFAQAVRSLGVRWPGRGELDRVLASGGLNIGLGYGAESWPQLVGYVTNKRAAVEALIETFESSGSDFVRAQAYHVLVELWPDELARRLLIQRATDEIAENARGPLFQALSDTWPDDATRTLLMKHAREDPSAYVRTVILEILLDKWPDDATRRLLVDCFTNREEEHSLLRHTALKLLARTWPEGDTRGLVDRYMNVDGAAATLAGARHSRFGGVIFTVDLDGTHPYLDPTVPVSSGQIAKAATKLSLRPEEAAEVVKSLSEHLGWDITRGSGAPDEPPSKSEPQS